jgi:hypothetical protein
VAALAALIRQWRAFERELKRGRQPVPAPRVHGRAARRMGIRSSGQK